MDIKLYSGRNMSEGQHEPVLLQTADDQGAEGPSNRWPQPVPEDWKKGRAEKAEEWFQQQKEELAR